MPNSNSTNWKRLALAGLIVLSGCATQPPPKVVPTAGTQETQPILATAKPIQPLPTLDELVDRELADGDELLIGAGDIAECGAQLSHAQDTAKIIDRFSNAKVFTMGDNAYLNGTKAQFEQCYGESWGRFKEHTRPSPGNHDYGIYPPEFRDNADPYFNYFGTNAGTKGLGYYSFPLGSWHIVSLNSMADQTGAPPMGQQLEWLRNDLNLNQQRCVLAYWHHPLFSSGTEHGDKPGDPGRSMWRLWEPLLDHHATVIVNGHDHHYERFKQQDTHQKLTASGIRQFIVGTGGGDKRGLLPLLEDNSEYQIGNVYGVLLLTLHKAGYEWHFIDTDGKVRDAGSGECN
ncbi:MAG: metallophosphoesterase [Acidobacteriota bacterium]